MGHFHDIIHLFKIINVVAPEPPLWKSASAVAAAAVDLNGIGIYFASDVTFSLIVKPILINGWRILPRNPPVWIILEICDFYINCSIIYKMKILKILKTLRRFATCLYVNNKLCRVKFH